MVSKLSHFLHSFYHIVEHRTKYKAGFNLWVHVFTSALYAQQTSPYAEFYSLSGDSARIVDKLRLTGAGMKVKIFASTGKELNAKIKQAEVSFVQKGNVVRTITIRDTNEISISEFRSVAGPGDKVIVKIRQVENVDRKSPVYLSKTDFSFTLD